MNNARDTLKECQQFLEDMHTMPPEWTIKESQALHKKLAAIAAQPPQQDAALLDALHNNIKSIPSRKELSSGQWLSYVQRDEVLAYIEHAIVAANAAPVQDVADERPRFEKAMNDARFFPAEFSFARGKSPSGRDEYVNSHLQSQWEGWQARAALGQPIAKDEPFAYFQRNEGWNSWEEVIPSAAGKEGVVAAYTRQQPQELPVLSDEDVALLIYEHTGINQRQAPGEYAEISSLCRALLSRKPADGGDK